MPNIAAFEDDDYSVNDFLRSSIGQKPDEESFQKNNKSEKEIRFLVMQNFGIPPNFKRVDVKCIGEDRYRVNVIIAHKLPNCLLPESKICQSYIVDETKKGDQTCFDFTPELHHFDTVDIAEADQVP